MEYDNLLKINKTNKNINKTLQDYFTQKNNINENKSNKTSINNNIPIKRLFDELNLTKRESSELSNSDSI